MLSKRTLTTTERRKQILLARGDRLRTECSEIWSAVEQRAEAVERGVGWLQWVSPVVSLLSVAGLAYLRRNPSAAAGSGRIAPLLSLLARSAARGDEPES